MSLYTLLVVLLSVAGTLALLWCVKIARLLILTVKLVLTLGLARGLALAGVAGLASFFGGVGLNVLTVHNNVEHGLVAAATAPSPVDAKQAILTAVETAQQATQGDSYLAVVSGDEAEVSGWVGKLEHFHDTLTYKVYKDETAFQHWKSRLADAFLTPRVNAWSGKTELVAKGEPLPLLLSHNRRFDYVGIVSLLGLALSATLPLLGRGRGKGKEITPVQRAVEQALAPRLRDLEAREAKLADTLAKVDAARKGLADEQKVLAAVRQEVESGRSSLAKEREDFQKQQRDDLAAWGTYVKDEQERHAATRAAEQKKFEGTWSELKRREAAEQKKFDVACSELKKREDDFEFACSELKKREADLFKSEKDYAKRSQDLAAREEEVGKREEASRNREKALLARETDVATREFKVSVGQRA